MPLAKITDPIATITAMTKRDKVVFGSNMGESAFVIFVELKVGNNPFSPYHIFIQAITPIARIIEPIMILLIPIIRSKPYQVLNKSNEPKLNTNKKSSDVPTLEQILQTGAVQFEGHELSFSSCQRSGHMCYFKSAIIAITNPITPRTILEMTPVFVQSQLDIANFSESNAFSPLTVVLYLGLPP